MPVAVASETCYRELFAHFPVAAVLCAADGRPLAVNRAASELLGLPDDDARRLPEWLIAEARAFAGDAADELRLSRRIEVRGRSVPIEVTLRRLGEVDRAIVGLLSETKEPEPDSVGAPALDGGSRGKVAEVVDFGGPLRESEVLYRALLASLPQRIFYKDRSGRFISVNEAFAADFGLTAAEMTGKSDHDLFPAELAGKYRADDERIAESRRPETLCEVNVAGGRTRVVEVTKAPAVRAGGEVLGVLGIFSDVTERVQAEEALRRTADELARSNEELQQFAYVASHDLQEPLRMVASYTQLLQRRYQDRLDQDANEFIAYAVDGATRMQALINALLDYSRVGTRGREFQPTALSDCLQDALADLRAAIEEAGARIEAEELPTVLADSVQMTQLFQNLVGNAVKFRGEKKPEVRITSRREGDEWVIAVRDNGIGIAPEYVERIFVIFQRLHGKAEYPGTGIGLAVCKKIAARHGGRIWVESEEGAGATFCVALPVRADD